MPEIVPPSRGVAAWEGCSVGAVSIKRARILEDGTVQADVRRHGGDLTRVLRDLLCEEGPPVAGVAVTGCESETLLTLPYVPESICIEAALRCLGLAPDLVLSLGGETFVAYCMSGGVVRGMHSSNRCAAGSGEFLVQQLGRMDLELEAGVELARDGRLLPLASRCSVHAKSDATHKLNKGECTPADIARSIVGDLAAKIARLVDSVNWSSRHLVLAGGLTQNPLLVADLRAALSGSQIDLLPHSGYLEAFGAAAVAREKGAGPCPPRDRWLRENPPLRRSFQPPLAAFAPRVTRVVPPAVAPSSEGAHLVLGVDAGSTTTKAVLLERESGAVVASCYLRTHGNPVHASAKCLASLSHQLSLREGAGSSCKVAQMAVTGSGRDLVSVYLDNCLSFNEILAHARAARSVTAEIDTLFEIGGQDAKFVVLQSGVPVDYSMNDGCSAGTGSFLEEAAASDMHVPVDEIGPLALAASRPLAFGERCAAFINSEVRAALRQGSSRDDVLAGLVYAIADNYLARVVGARHVGHTILLQGGLALNVALAPAIAARTGREVVVPPRPELMGAIGAAYMAVDLLQSGSVQAVDRELHVLGRAVMEARGVFACQECANRCEIRKIALNDRVYPFGGQCARWEMQRRSGSFRREPGRDLVALRGELMFGTYAPGRPARTRGRVGLPLALTTYELYPLYAKVLAELGYEVVLSRPGRGNRRTYSPTCYPGELLVAAVDDLLSQNVDWVFLPHLREHDIPAGHAHAYSCPVVNDIPGVVRAQFRGAASRILSPELGLSDHLLQTSEEEVGRMAEQLGLPFRHGTRAFRAAFEHQRAFAQAYREAVLAALACSTRPAVILVGRPYTAFAPEANLSVSRKIASRGFTVVPGDGLPFDPPGDERNVWGFTQRVMSAVEYSRRREGFHICALSCFSCGPDAILHHRFRHELEGVPFCFLEIDSHTADAGVETRIGAFLDIIQDRQERAGNVASGPRSRASARLVREEKKSRVIDAAGRRLNLNHPRVVHVLLPDHPPLAAGMLIALYETLGWRAVAPPSMSPEIMQRARRVCSGRECLPFQAMMGKVVAHLETRSPGEMSVFHLLEMEGPCQSGNFFDAMRSAVTQLGCDDAVAAWPTVKNNYLATGNGPALLNLASIVAADLMGEAENALRLLAADRQEALALLEALNRDLIAASRRGLLAVERELAHAASRLARVRLQGRLEDLPRLLLFGGIHRMSVQDSIREFFEQRAILVKTNDISEFAFFVNFEWVMRSGLAHGQTRAERQLSLPVMVGNLIAGRRPRSDTLLALRSRVNCTTIEWLAVRWRRLMERSGLLFAFHLPFQELAQQAQQRLSLNSYTEAPITVGRYFGSLRHGGYDGHLNVGAFNCAPANTSAAIIGALTRSDTTPYAAIESDGVVIGPSQARQLETLAAQCHRYHAQRMG
ncbi:MAG TPA: acyl-CoA dehydratase activase [Anaeromyxobacteraceae bacterium]|nr:acyl-CoA dehydratase activase [Anaeromyxobacteraceae bacterium]